ncbi:hypothetical protein ACP70R_003771 [Stipagrostis hirtigluma subsp. patula]
MPKRSRESSEEAAAMAGGEDRLGALPDDALLRVLSLLPSEDAVRTCVLARRWRHLWRSTPALRVARDDDRRWSVRWLRRFVSRFLRLRDGRVPLDECDLLCRPFVLCRGGAAAEASCFEAAERWIRRAVSVGRARVLKLSVGTPENRFQLADAPLVSQQLTRVELDNIELQDGTLDLSGCPALEDLEITSCSIEADQILLPPVKRLRIMWCYFNIIPRSSISAPSLVSLQLSENAGFTPLLESMPSLVTAFVRLDNQCSEICANNNYFGDCGYDSCNGCYGNLFYEDDDNDQCVLLDGLSGATHLELTALPEVFVCRKDFKWDPTFSKLKTLLLNEWCVDAGFSALIYFLQRSPILEKLTLQLHKAQEPAVVEANGCYNAREESLVSKHLR